MSITSMGILRASAKHVLVVKAEIIIGALCIPLILTVLAMVVWTHNQT